MAKTIDLRRHFKNDGDVLTAEGVAAGVQAPLAKGEGVRIVAGEEGFSVAPLA